MDLTEQEKSELKALREKEELSEEEKTRLKELEAKESRDVELSEEEFDKLVNDKVKAAIDKKDEEYRKEINELKKQMAGNAVDQTQPKSAANPQTAREKAWEEKLRKAQQNSGRELPPEDEFSFVRLFEAQLNHDWNRAPFERFAMSKSLEWQNASSAGYWVDDAFLPEQFITYLHAQQIVRRAVDEKGGLVITPNGAPVQIPKLTGGVTTYWVGQNENLTKSDVTPGQLEMNPHFCVARSQISEFLASISGGAAETIIRQDMARQIALALDNAYLEGAVGTTSESNPTGLANISGIQTFSVSNSDLTMANLRSMRYYLEKENVDTDGRVWFMHPRTWDSLLALAPTNSLPYINPNQMDSDTKRILGYPVYTSTQISITNTNSSKTANDCANVFLVNVGDLIVAEFGGLSIKGTDVGGNAWSQNAIEIKATTVVDFAARHPKGIVLCNDTTS